MYRIQRMRPGPNGETLCELEGDDGFTQFQYLFRVYLIPLVNSVGILANAINVVVFSHKHMRSQLVNWFFLALSVSDILVLFSSFFVFSFPVYAELSKTADLSYLQSIFVYYFYPIAQTSLTMTVYLTVFVSAHRYLGVCHPFLIRRISNRNVVLGVIVAAVVFAVSFNIPRWLELSYVSCYNNETGKSQFVVTPTAFMLDPGYTLIYRNILYTAIMFILPFLVLIILNVRIVSTLQMSNKLRRQMTVQQNGPKMSAHRFPGIKPAETTATIVTKKKSGILTLKGTFEVSERRDHGVTIMLVVITSEFLLFNLLAFAHNILEITGSTTVIETYLVEISTLLVNINGASTIVVYLIFSSKYRAIFLQLFSGSAFSRWASTAAATSFFSLGPNETTQLLTNASYDRTKGRRTSSTFYEERRIRSVPTLRTERSASIVAAHIEQRKLSMQGLPDFGAPGSRRCLNKLSLMRLDVVLEADSSEGHLC